MRHRIVALLLLVSTVSFAQRMNQCGFKIPDNIMLPNSFQSVYEARDIIVAMLDSIGWKENFNIQEQPNISNAYATIMNGKRFIIYDNDFLEKIDYAAATKWASISVLAHEMGHHYKNHVVDGQGSTPPKEIEADYFSGFAMNRMGASLNESIVAMQKIASDQGSTSHPPKDQRIAAITQGWNQAQKTRTTTAAGPVLPPKTNVPPPPAPTKPVDTKPTTAPPATTPADDPSWIYLTNTFSQTLTVYLSDDGRKFEALELKPNEPFVFKFDIYNYGWMRLTNTATARPYKLFHNKDYSIIWSRRSKNWIIVEIP
jgi:Peptidase family M48